MGEQETRDRATRITDAIARLEGDADMWVATAHDGRPWLVPLSFHWTGEVLLTATGRRTTTYRNLAAGGGARIALGHTRDVVMLDVEVDLPEGLPAPLADAAASVSGNDPRTDPRTAYLRLAPRRIQAWRTYAETRDRTIMRDGRWATSP